MQFEDFDNKVRQAADQHHPNYDEKAWAKMENLLDRHLPQKGDRRRRIIFFLLFFLLIGGGAWLVISKPWQKSNQDISTVNSPYKNQTAPSAGPANEATDRSTAGNLSGDKKKNKEIITESVIENPVVAIEEKNSTPVADAVIQKKKDQAIIVANEKVKATTHKQDKVMLVKNNKADQIAIEIISPEKIKKDKNPAENNTIVSSPGNSTDKIPAIDSIKTTAGLPVNNDLLQNKTIEPKKDNITGQPEVPVEKNVTKKSSSKKSNSFFFSVSSGPDVSSVGFDKPGKVKLLAGAGFGYTFKNRWTIRTGFYSARKLYSAKPDEYKPSVPINTLYLENISANCKVYEIPLSVAYNFSLSKKYSLFASAGLSSLIMKKETYDYEYKYLGGQPWVYTKTLANENKHYFSVLTLSGGYVRKINKTFSIAAEPYLKLPLTGIGFGKVKLNSAGILFSVTISPFQAGTKK